jgi:hypothetical protein
MTVKVYQQLAQLIDARLHCGSTNNVEWADKHRESIERIIKDYLPHGSGIDSSCHIDFEKSHGDKIVINTAFHHMDDNGYYAGWTEHRVTVVPSLAFGFRLSISGRNRNDIKSYLGDTFYYAFNQELK